MNNQRHKKMNLAGGKIRNFIGAVLMVFGFLAGFTSQAAAQSAHSLAQYQTAIKNQGSRATCWAFAGVAALEAAYNRKYGLELDLSEQYTFHMLKVMELQPRVPDNNTSLNGFQGGSGIVQQLTRFAIPEDRFAPYLTGEQMEQLRVKLKVGDIVNAPSQTGYDTFELSEEHIPMVARWNARYRVTDYGWISNPTFSFMLEATLLENREIVADFDSRWRLNAETNVYEFDANAAQVGHVMLIIGFDQNAGVFLVKNSYGGDFIRLTYECVRKNITGAYYIKDVADANTVQKQARYLGIWDFDHFYNNVRLKGKLVIRRFTDLRSVDWNFPTKLGSLYLDNGSAPFDVIGYFANDGEGIILDIAHPAGNIRVTYPFGFWRVVDSNYTGWLERGTLEQPFRSLAAAANSIHAGGVIIVQPGSHAAIGTYNKPMTIRPLYGAVTLGN